LRPISWGELLHHETGHLQRVGEGGARTEYLLDGDRKIAIYQLILDLLGRTSQVQGSVFSVVAFVEESGRGSDDVRGELFHQFVPRAHVAIDRVARVHFDHFRWTVLRKVRFVKSADGQVQHIDAGESERGIDEIVQRSGIIGC